jgi:hypothetical protein
MRRGRIGRVDQFAILIDEYRRTHSADTIPDVADPRVLASDPEDGYCRLTRA